MEWEGTTSLLFLYKCHLQHYSQKKKYTNNNFITLSAVLKRRFGDGGVQDVDYVDSGSDGHCEAHCG